MKMLVVVRDTYNVIPYNNSRKYFFMLERRGELTLHISPLIGCPEDGQPRAFSRAALHGLPVVSAIARQLVVLSRDSRVLLAVQVKRTAVVGR